MKICSGSYTPIDGRYSKDLKAIIDSCLNKDFKRRPEIQSILKMQGLREKAL